jgi:hypothetical protein
MAASGHGTQPIFAAPIEGVVFQASPAVAYSTGFAPADFFLFWRVKEELMGLYMDKDSLNETCVGFIRTIAADEFATAIKC